MPVTGVKWRPNIQESKTKNVLVATTADGGIIHWHSTSGRILHTEVLEDNQCLCLDFSKSGRQLAVGCSNMTIKVFDESTKQILTELLPGMGDRLGHANRIFAVKWVGEDRLLSAGWDNNIILWDVRTGNSIRGNYGPHICGDGIDIRGNMILTSSYHV
mmetsp:Transcript_31918/g.5781  ORF Transcript_31918/g.5781 Transcript_31918/m.5781 type:complete len:159 (-) Transcript_31918:37-513(-)